MFTNFRLSTKLLVTFVPLFIIAIVVSADVNIALQEELIEKQALESAGQKGQILREALVNQMTENQQVKDEFLERIQHVAGISDLYIRIVPENLHLREFLQDSVRTQRLTRRMEFANAKDEIDNTYGRRALETGQQQWLRTGDNFRAMIPFKAEKKCLACHEVQIGHTLGVAHIGFPLSEILGAIKDSSLRAALISLGFSIVTIVLGFLFYRSLIQTPIRKLEKAAEEIGKGNLGYTIEISEAKDELGNLSRAFEQMRRALKESESAFAMSTVGQVATSLIQDFRTPLKDIVSSIDQIQRTSMDEEQKRQLCDSARYAVQMVNRMTQDLLDYTTGELKVDKKLSNVPQLLRNVFTIAKPDLDKENIKLEVTPGFDGNAILDPERVTRALASIISYASNYVPSGGIIKLVSESTGSNLLLKIIDNGSGVPEQFKNRIFEPFVKIVKGKGVGIELALAKRIIEKQGGTIEVSSEEGTGTVYAITMPF